MLSNHGSRCMKKQLRKVVCNEKLFGGKVLVVGSDLLRTLPVVVRGTRTDIIQICIKLRNLWIFFFHLPLNEHMLIAGYNKHTKWLLQSCMVLHPSIECFHNDCTVGVPQSMIEIRDIINSFFKTQVSEKCPQII